MNNTLHITAAFDKPDFLEDLVEKLADGKADAGYGTSSTEAYVSGDVSLSYAIPGGKQARINMPFITCFLFTCTKAKTQGCKLAWSISLS